MLYLAAKALLSGLVIAIVSELAKKTPALGALILSLPLVSILAFIWLWRETADNEGIAALSQSTFWFILPTLPMFLVLAGAAKEWRGLPRRSRAVLPAHHDPLRRDGLDARQIRHFALEVRSQCLCHCGARSHGSVRGQAPAIQSIAASA